MKIIYISKARLPTEKAYGTSMVKTCEALAKAGVEVEMLVPKCGNKTAPCDVFSYYGVKRIFVVRYLPTFDVISRGWHRGFWINHVSFLFSVLLRNIGDKRKCVIFARDELAAFFLKMKGYKVFYDMHGFPEKKRWFWKIILRRIDGIVATNEWKIIQCTTHFGILKENIIIAPNGFDADAFRKNWVRATLRKNLGLPPHARIVLYTGHLYDWKGAHILLEVARNRQETFVFVGGTEGDILMFRKRAHGFGNVLVLGHKPPAEIPKYLKAADVLVLPNSQFSQSARFSVYSQLDTSPIKLFEYMASGVPIVASALPSIREILNEANAVLVIPDSPEALAQGIGRIFSDEAHAERIAEAALKESKEYTWDKRAERILRLIRA